MDTGKYIYPIQQDSLAMQLSKERCNYVYVSDGMPQVSSFFVFKKNFSGIEEFNRQIILNQAFVQRTFNKYFSEVEFKRLTIIHKIVFRDSNLDSFQNAKQQKRQRPTLQSLWTLSQ